MTLKPALCTGALLLSLMPLAQATATFGSLGNFDTVNDTGSVAHGFEIDLEGLDKSRITDVFGLNRNFGTPSPGDVERYGLPVVSDLLDGSGHVIGSRITYMASFNAGSWSASTLSGAFNTPGESCWKFGNVGYPNVPCDHFGVSTLGNPTKTTYSWLVESGTPGVLKAANVAIPSVSFTPPPVPAPGVPAAPVQAAILAQAVDPVVPQNNAFWVKIVQTTLPENVGLNDLLGGHHAGENKGVAGLAEAPETEIEWQVLQIGKVDEVTKAIDLKGNPALALKFEFYKYQGTFDGEGLVDPTALETPHGNVLTASVGAYVGEQIAGFNAVQAVPEPGSALMLLAGLGVIGIWRARRA